ncbi:MAG: BamA/TamA family outer membrane protein [Bacteroidota bacterium]
MKTYHLQGLLIVLLLCLSSCANYRLNVGPTEKDNLLEEPTDGQIRHTMYLIGDAGDASPDQLSPALALLEQKLATAPEASSVVFLGDNINPGGMPPKSEKSARKKSEDRLDAQLKILKDFKGRPVFIPGNQDWRYTGLKGLRRQEKYVEKKLNKGIEEEDDWENYFYPNRGCGGPELVELDENLVVIVVDSHWFLSDWDKETEINDGCDAKSRKVFTFNFEEMVRKNRNKNVIIAMHHPVYSNGKHGGYFTAKQHLFPLTEVNENLYVPLPIIGSFSAFLRGLVGTRQDIAHHRYKELKASVMAAAKKNGNFIFASGHDQSLQYFENDNQYFIVSGSGSKTGPARLGNGALFAYGHSGFAQLDIYEDGTTWLQFWAVGKNHPQGEVVYRKKVRGPLQTLISEVPDEFPEYDQLADTISTRVLTTPLTSKGALHSAILGKHYRHLYLHDYQFPVLHLDTFQGGVTPIKRGGGNQTNSLRLLDASDQQWVMRSMTKDASRFIPYPFNKITAAQSIVEDNFLSTHPFAANAVPLMSSAVGVYHANPRLFYIPKQLTLGTYNDVYGKGVYLVEERAAKDWSNQPSFGNSEKLIGTPDVVDKLAKNHKHYIDYAWVVKSRLFDMLIGDWDRHDDQWRWASFKDGERTYYRPIPRDRDQPFSKYDGMVTAIARLTLPFLKQLQPYRTKFGNPKWANYNARQFDKTFMIGAEWSVWEREAKALQEKLSDEVIETAFRTWPEVVYNDPSTKEIMDILKSRRNDLMNIARSHYELLANIVDVPGTNKRDWFEIERQDRNTIVRRYGMSKKGERRELLFERNFLADETKEIHLYGLNGDDRFEIKGKASKGPRLRIIGGLDEDEIIDESKVSGISKKTWFYDSVEGNKLELGTEGRNRTTNNRESNIYNRKDYHYEYDFVMPFPLVGFNPDDGFLAGLSTSLINYQFKKSPYGQTHSFLGTFAFATRAYNITYTGDYLNVFGRWDLLVDARFQAPQYVINFFGLGNETIRDFDRSLNFYRVRQSLYRVKPAFKRRTGGDNGFFNFGPLVERIEVEDTDNRFITEPTNGLPENVFESKYYAGAEMGFSYENVDNLQMTTRGLRFHSSLAWRQDLEDSDRQNTHLSGELTIYQSLSPSDRIIFATRIGAAHNFDDFEFFQAAILGGTTNLRGYNAQRFYGKTSFYHNLDLRIKLFTLNNNVLPFSVGMNGGFDYGRVWIEEEDSSDWHHSFGGGLWLSPIDFIVLNFELFRAEEITRFTFGLGYSF